MTDDLRARIDAAIRPNMLLGLQDAELYDKPGAERIGEWAAWISDTVAGLVQPELDRLTALLADHATCAVCGHERHQHGREPILRHDWCRGCNTTTDLHTFKPEEPS